jgi:hypothetical protein
MTRPIPSNTVLAARRRVFMLIYGDAQLTPWAGTVTGVKPQLSVNGTTEVPAANDVVRVGGALHYVELTQAEANLANGALVFARLPAAAGRLEAYGSGLVFADDPTLASATDASIATATVDRIAGVDGAAARTAIATASATAVQAALYATAWGVQTQPSGGSTQTLVVADPPGTVSRFFSGPNLTGAVVGQTPLVP